MALDYRGPTGERARPLWVRSFGYWSFQYRRTWRSSLSTSVLEPLLYLAALGIGLGTLVDRHVHHVQGVTYLAFVAPGLLAAAAMQVGVSEASYPVMGAIKWMKTYLAMLATPLRVIDVLRGHVAWIALRLALSCGIFLGILAALGLVRSWEAALVLPAGVLTGLAFCTPVAAFAATRENDVAFSVLYRFGVVPLFLFSGVFFPITVLPGWLQPLCWATPLFHGVALCRSLVLGDAALGMSVAHAAYLVALVLAGYAAARVTYRRRLVQ
jgi:lipooligosaccharide transport system permease protein